MTTAYICSMFIGGSLGSALASGIYASGGWQGLGLLGGLLPAILITTWIWVNSKGSPHHIKA